MIYILHGEDLPSARNFILNLQKQNNIAAKHEFSIDNEPLNEMASIASATDMFGEKTMTVFDVSKAGRANVDAYVELMESIPEDFLFVVLSSKELTSKNAFIKAGNNLGARTMLFKGISKSNVFKFVDCVFDRNRAAAYKELQRLLLDGEDAIYLLTMLTYGLRSIAYAKFNSPAFNKLAPFVKSKVQRQAQNFSEGQILSFYQRFYELDRDLKIGKAPAEIGVPIAIETILSLGVTR